MSEIAKGYSFENSGVEVQKVIAGPMVELAADEESRGGILRIKHLFKFQTPNENPDKGFCVHNMGWLNREGIDSDTGDLYSYHMAFCDCLPLAEGLEQPSLMLECPYFVHGLLGRAHAIRGDEALQTLLEDEPNYEAAARFGLSNFDFVDPRIIEGIMYLLKHDKAHPEAWVGNCKSGSHEIVLLSQILGLPLEETKLYAMLMEEIGLTESPNGVDIQLAA